MTSPGYEIPVADGRRYINTIMVERWEFSVYQFLKSTFYKNQIYSDKIPLGTDQ